MYLKPQWFMAIFNKNEYLLPQIKLISKSYRTTKLTTSHMCTIQNYSSEAGSAESAWRIGATGSHENTNDSCALLPHAVIQALLQSPLHSESKVREVSPSLSKEAGKIYYPKCSQVHILQNQVPGSGHCILSF